jgi:hypothetical protein
MPKKEVDALLDETKDELPIPADDMPAPLDPTERDADGRLKRRPLSHSTLAKTHPLAVGLKEAKAIINEILKDESNLEHLRIALQTKFSEDPIKFLLTMEPLMKRYEKLSSEGKEEKAKVRLYVKGGETAVEISSEGEDDE